MAANSEFDFSERLAAPHFRRNSHVIGRKAAPGPVCIARSVGLGPVRTKDAQPKGSRALTPAVVPSDGSRGRTSLPNGRSVRPLLWISIGTVLLFRVCEPHGPASGIH
jgi:hypothetical protein